MKVLLRQSGLLAVLIVSRISCLSAQIDRVESAPPRPQPGQLAPDRVTGETCGDSVDGIVASRARISPRAAATLYAKQIWADKLKEADEQGFRWGRAIRESAMLLAIEHAYRFGDQPYTRAELKGPWLKDYLQSVRGLSGWHDTDSWLANYAGHPMQGAVSGYFQIHNDPRGRLQEFGKSTDYWKSRMKAFGWAAAYSTAYELGPLGESAWGNVGHVERNPGTKGAVDLVITPTLGLALMMTEDIIDRHIVWPIEKRTNNAMVKRLLRCFLGMQRSFSNLFRFTLPWRVDSRGPVNQPAIRYSQLPR